MANGGSKSAAEVALPTAAPKASTSAAPTLVKPTPVWRTKLASFLAGVAVTSIAGYVRLREDVFAATAAVNSSVAAAHKDVEVTALKLRALEDRMAKVEASNATLVAKLK